MRSSCLSLGLGVSLCAVILVSTAVAQQVNQECLCQGRYQLGQVVTLLVDNPADAVAAARAHLQTRARRRIRIPENATKILH